VYLQAYNAVKDAGVSIVEADQVCRFFDSLDSSVFAELTDRLYDTLNQLTVPETVPSATEFVTSWYLSKDSKSKKKSKVKRNKQQQSKSEENEKIVANINTSSKKRHHSRGGGGGGGQNQFQKKAKFNNNNQHQSNNNNHNKHTNNNSNNTTNKSPQSNHNKFNSKNNSNNNITSGPPSSLSTLEMRRISASLVAHGVKWTITILSSVVCFSVTWQRNTPVVSNEVVLVDLEIIIQITTQTIEFILSATQTTITATCDQLITS
jgi:hypothetical protein